MARLYTENLKKTYGHREVVKGISIQVNSGEIVGLLGPNGAGKTTTFNMIIGFIRPNSGEVYLDGQKITSYPMYRCARLGIGYLAQDVSIFRKLTVEQNLMAIIEMRGDKKNVQRQMLEKLMDEFGIAHLAKNMAYTLSGGERRRVEIARALVTHPTFMLMDEPFSGVDPKAVQDLQELVTRLKEKGLGILITDHSVRETLQVTDRSYLIAEGKIEISGSAKEIINDPRARELYLGERFSMEGALEK